MEHDEELLTFQRFMLAFDTPAFLRRAQQVAGEWTHLVACCRRERERRLEIPRLRLAQLWEGVPPGSPLRERCAPEATWQELERLYLEWSPTLRTAPPRAHNATDATGLMTAVRNAFARFNRKWRAFVDGVDLAPVNRARESYNKYYVREKECAVRSSRTAREGFTPLVPATTADLLAEAPLLPELSFGPPEAGEHR